MFSWFYLMLEGTYIRTIDQLLDLTIKHNKSIKYEGNFIFSNKNGSICDKECDTFLQPLSLQVRLSYKVVLIKWHNRYSNMHLNLPAISPLSLFISLLFCGNYYVLILIYFYFLVLCYLWWSIILNCFHKKIVTFFSELYTANWHLFLLLWFLTKYKI